MNLYFRYFPDMLPMFDNLQRSYPGNVDYGGLYSDNDIFKALNVSQSYPRKDNDTCILRMSTALNLNPGHQVRRPYKGSAQGAAGNYYFYDRKWFLTYLEQMYGLPLKSNTTDTFRGRVGIMFINVTSGKESSDVCSVLLWNGMSFHQGKGYLHHYSIKNVFLWPAPTGMPAENVIVARQVQDPRFPTLRCLTCGDPKGELP